MIACKGGELLLTNSNGEMRLHVCIKMPGRCHNPITGYTRIYSCIFRDVHMIYIFINLLPIAAATFLGLAIGIAWLRLSGAALPGWKVFAGIMLAEFWLASILAGALILAPPQAGVWVMALGSAVVIWVGFVMPVLWVTFAAYGRGARPALSASLHWLCVMVGQAVVMQVIGLSQPPGA